MTKLVYVKKVKTESDDLELYKLFFNGGAKGLKFELKINGEADAIGDLMREFKLDYFGQHIDMKLENNQTSLEDHNGEKE